MSDDPRKNDWLSPSTLFGALGFISLLLSAYLTFQRDVGSQINGLMVRMAVVESKIDVLVKR